MSCAGKLSLRVRKLVKLLPEFLPDVFNLAGVVGPLGPACGDRLQNEIHVGGLPLLFKQLRVFEVLNSVADGFQAYSRGRFSGGNRARRIKENPITWPCDAGTASVGVQIVPTADGVSGGPPVSAVVKNAAGALGPVEKSRLNAFVDRRIVDQPFRRIAKSRLS